MESSQQQNIMLQPLPVKNLFHPSDLQGLIEDQPKEWAKLDYTLEVGSLIIKEWYEYNEY